MCTRQRTPFQHVLSLNDTHPHIPSYPTPILHTPRPISICILVKNSVRVTQRRVVHGVSHGQRRAHLPSPEQRAALRGSFDTSALEQKVAHGVGDTMGRELGNSPPHHISKNTPQLHRIRRPTTSTTPTHTARPSQYSRPKQGEI